MKLGVWGANQTERHTWCFILHGTCSHSQTPLAQGPMRWGFLIPGNSTSTSRARRNGGSTYLYTECKCCPQRQAAPMQHKGLAPTSHGNPFLNANSPTLYLISIRLNLPKCILCLTEPKQSQIIHAASFHTELIAHIPAFRCFKEGRDKDIYPAPSAGQRGHQHAGRETCPGGTSMCLQQMAQRKLNF